MARRSARTGERSRRGGTRPATRTAAATRTSFLRNVLVRVPEYRRDLAAIKPPPGEEARPFTHFLKLEAPVFKAAAPDHRITFRPEPLNSTTDKADWIGAISLSGEGAPVIATATAREVRLASGAKSSISRRKRPTLLRRSQGILPSISITTSRLISCSPAKVACVFSGRTLPPLSLTSQQKPNCPRRSSIANTPPRGPRISKLTAISTHSRLERRHFRLFCETTATALSLKFILSPESPESTDFAWADLDADGDPDAALIDGSGKLHVFSNERQGQFTERAVPAVYRRARVERRRILITMAFSICCVARKSGSHQRALGQRSWRGMGTVEARNSNTTLPDHVHPARRRSRQQRRHSICR